jgi:hypothetical protein
VTVRRSAVTDNQRDGISVAVIGPVHVVDNVVRRNGGNGIRGAFDSLRTVDHNVVSRNAGFGILVEDSVSTITNNVMRRNGGTGLSISETVPEFIPRYVVSDNLATWNGNGGMSASSSPDPPGPPAGEGNAARNNAVFQCRVIVCSRFRGFADDGDDDD